MKNIRIILIAFLTIAISNMGLSYWRHRLYSVHVIESKCFDHRLTISPSGLTDELDNDPACVQKSMIVSSSRLLEKDYQYLYLGAITPEIVEIFYGLPIKLKQSKIYPGTFEVVARNETGYWGPNGFSHDDISVVGQFGKDVIMTYFLNCQYVYDKQAKRLYKLKLGMDIDHNYNLTSYPGLDIPESLDVYQIASTYISATFNQLDFGGSYSTFMPAARFATEEEGKNTDNLRMGKLGDIDGKPLVGIDSVTTGYRCWVSGLSNITYLVERSGDIYQADFDSGKVEKLNVGERGDVATLCRDNYSYSFCPIYKVVYDRPKTGNEKADADIKIVHDELIGYVENRLSLAGELFVNVYDTKGKKLASQSESGYGRYFGEETANLREIRNIIENLPGILPVTLSYLTCDWFTPIETWQTLFLMPGSVANYAAMTSGSDIAILAYWENASLSVVITIALLIWFAFNVKKYGISARQRKFWQYLIVLFGPAAFLAYMIVRPKIVQVTCGNCGKLRRPDQDNCHNCRAGWNMPQNKEVDWQIYSGQ